MLGGGEEASASFSRHELAQDPLPRESPPLISQVPTYQNLYSFKGLESAPVSSHLPLTCAPPLPHSTGPISVRCTACVVSDIWDNSLPPLLSSNVLSTLPQFPQEAPAANPLTVHPSPLLRAPSSYL